MMFTSEPKPATKKGRQIRKTESFVILEEPPFTPSAHSSINRSVSSGAAPRNTVVGGSAPATFAIDVSLRRGRLALLTLAMVGVIVTIVRLLEQGYEIRRYAAKLESAEQKRLLDTYNSYSGNIVSVFGKPIELFVTACVQVVLLRFVSAWMLRNERSWKAVYGALALSAGVGYLINNGFNSLNVQLVELQLQAAVNASDLDEAVISSFAEWGSRITNSSNSVSENQTSNPVANTVLRNLIEPRALRAKTVCEPKGAYEMRTPFLMDTVEYGFPQRDWMKKLLPEAFSATTLQLMINATNKSANSGVKIGDLPMNAPIAADLVIYSMILCKELLPLVIVGPTFNSSKKEPEYNTSAAIRVGLLPSNTSESEDIQRKWFLDHVEGYLTARISTKSWVKMSDIPLSFSHVDIAKDISFDAVSIEVEMDPWYLQNYNNSKNGDRYMNSGVNMKSANYTFDCDPWPARCVFFKRDGPILSLTIKNEDIYYDAPSLIEAFSICVNDNGTEWIQSTCNGGEFDAYLNIQPCPSTSNTLMLLLSVGKRLMAEALTQNTTANASGIYPGGASTATNVRKIYSLTVDRLSGRQQTSQALLAQLATSPVVRAAWVSHSLSTRRERKPRGSTSLSVKTNYPSLRSYHHSSTTSTRTTHSDNVL